MDRFLHPVPILALFYLAWIAFEASVSVSDRQGKGSTSDKKTLELYALSQAVTVLSALWLGLNRFTTAHTVGFTLFIAGVSIRQWSIRTLGQYYSHLVCIQESHRIIDTGPYRYIRHPAYAGMVAAHLGIVVAFYNPVTAIAFILGMVPAIMIRMRIEENTLSAVPGYADFTKKRKRIIPTIW